MLRQYNRLQTQVVWLDLWAKLDQNREVESDVRVTESSYSAYVTEDLLDTVRGTEAWSLIKYFQN